MPVYTFIDKQTNEIFDVSMRIKDLDDYKEENPNHERYFDEVPALVSGVNQKVSSGFNDVLTRIAEAHPTSELADRHISKSIKQVRTERAVKEWRKKSSSVS